MRAIIKHRKDIRRIVWSGDYDGPMSPNTNVVIGNKTFRIHGHFVKVVGNQTITEIHVK